MKKTCEVTENPSKWTRKSVILNCDQFVVSSLGSDEIGHNSDGRFFVFFLIDFEHFSWLSHEKIFAIDRKSFEIFEQNRRSELGPVRRGASGDSSSWS